MNTRELLFTFDHELFLGKSSGTPENCLLRPGNAVVDILERYGLRGVFFVDTTYLLRLEDMALRYAAVADDLGQITGQLQDLLRRGHEIYPHIHPHWQDAVYDVRRNTWKLTDLSKYRFSELSPALREQIFEGSMRILRHVLASAGSAQRIDAFRAGGWCIQPFTDFEPHFRKHGIQYDLSVLAGAKRSTNAVRYDFTAPLPADAYRFSTDVMLPVPDGSYTELAISMVDLSSKGILDNLLNKVLWRIPHGRQMGDGQGVPFVDLEEGLSIKGQRREMMSIELLNALRLPAFVRHIEDHAFTQFISHPKMLSPHHLSMLDRLLGNLSERFELRSDWKAYAGKVTG